MPTVPPPSVWAAGSRRSGSLALEVLGKEERLPVWELEGKDEKPPGWAGPWLRVTVLALVRAHRAVGESELAGAHVVVGAVTTAVSNCGMNLVRYPFYRSLVILVVVFLVVVGVVVVVVVKGEKDWGASDGAQGCFCAGMTRAGRVHLLAGSHPLVL